MNSLFAYTITSGSDRSVLSRKWDYDLGVQGTGDLLLRLSAERGDCFAAARRVGEFKLRFCGAHPRKCSLEEDLAGSAPTNGSDMSFATN